jgi:hypothetical protein
MHHDPYQVLGVQPGSSLTEIKAAFRRLVLENHPDRTGGSSIATERFHEIVAAYKELLRRPLEIDGPPIPSARPTKSGIDAVESKVNLNVLGLFVGLAIAGIGAVMWRADQHRKSQRIRVLRLRR